MSAHLAPRRGRLRQPEVVRECLAWGAFATVVVPAVLILTGADVTTAALGAGVVAALTAAIFVIVRMTGLSLPLLGSGETAEEPAAPPPEPLAPARAPYQVEAADFSNAPEQPWHEYAPPPPPWVPPAEPIGPTLGPYPDHFDGGPSWEDDRRVPEAYQPPEPWLPEPMMDSGELHPAEQRGRHRRGP